MGEAWRDTMTLCPENVDMQFDWDRMLETHEIIYVVKRPFYEFCFAVPRERATRLHQERPRLLIRFKDQCQMLGLVLEIGQIEDFFEGLSRLMEYVRAEEARRQE
jgi:hypothetical protein